MACISVYLSDTAIINSYQFEIPKRIKRKLDFNSFMKEAVIILKPVHRSIDLLTASVMKELNMDLDIKFYVNCLALSCSVNSTILNGFVCEIFKCRQNISLNIICI